MVKIYDIENIDSKIIVDVDSIDGINFHGNFHLYLFRNPKQKTLVYAYLKHHDGSVNLSYVHNLFNEFDNVDYFNTQKHKDRLIKDQHYKRVFNKYVHTREDFWCVASARYNSHIFDSKYLMLGEYQKIVANGMKDAGAIHTNIAGLYAYTRSLTLVNTANALERTIEHKKSLEREFYDDLFTVFNKTKPDYLTAYGYSNYIEIYDTISELLFRVTIKKDNFHEYEIIFPTKKKGKDKQTSTNLSFNFIIKQLSVATLLNRLMSESYRIKTNKFLYDLNTIKKSDEAKIYINSISSVLNDLIEKNNQTKDLTYKAMGIFVRDGIIEKNIINISKENQLFRIQRNIKFNKAINTDIELKSYYIMGGVREIATELFMIDFINIHNIDSTPDNLEYDLISKRKFSASKIFLKEPIRDILNENMYEYECVQTSLDSELETYVIKGEQFEPNIHKVTMSKFYVMQELKHYKQTGEKIISKTNNLLTANTKLAKQIEKKELEKSLI